MTATPLFKSLVPHLLPHFGRDFLQSFLSLREIPLAIGLRFQSPTSCSRAHAKETVQTIQLTRISDVFWVKEASMPDTNTHTQNVLRVAKEILTRNQHIDKLREEIRGLEADLERLLAENFRIVQADTQPSPRKRGSSYAKVIDTLQNARKPMSRGEITKLSGLSAYTVNDCIRRGMKGRHIKRVRRGQYALFNVH